MAHYHCSTLAQWCFHKAVLQCESFNVNVCLVHTMLKIISCKPQKYSKIPRTFVPTEFRICLQMRQSLQNLTNHFRNLFCRKQRMEYVTSELPIGCQLITEVLQQRLLITRMQKRMTLRIQSATNFLLNRKTILLDYRV